jgi:hypothetical protein
MGRVGTLPAEQLLAFDDFGDQLSTYSFEEASRLAVLLNIALKNGSHRAVFVMTPDQSREYIAGASYSQKLLGALKVTVCVVTPEARAILHVLMTHFETELASREIRLALSRAGATAIDAMDNLVGALAQHSVFDDLLPPNYETLEGELVAEPARSLTVLSRILDLAKSESILDDSWYEQARTQVLHSITGLHPHILHPGQPTYDDALAETGATGLPDGARRAVLTYITAAISTVPDPKHLALLLVRNQAVRIATAGTLAAVLYGNAAALLHLDYRVIEEQVLPHDPYTSRFAWMLRSVARYPWWVLLIEGLGSAPRNDALALGRLIRDGRAESDAGAVEFHHCVIILDAESAALLAAEGELDGLIDAESASDER